MAPRALPILAYRDWCVEGSCSSWLGGILDPDLPRIPVELCPRLVEDVEPEYETINELVPVDGCSRRVIGWIMWVEIVDVDSCFDIWASRSMLSFALFSSCEFCLSSLSFRLRSSSSFFASVLALEKPCRGAELQLGTTAERGLFVLVWERGPAISEDNDDGSGVLLVFEGSEREGGGETRPLEVSRLAKDGGKWLADIFGKEDDMAESRRRSCKRVRSTPPSRFWGKPERVGSGASASREDDTCCNGRGWGCERVADLGGEGGEASAVSADSLADRGLVRLVGIVGVEPDRARRWSR